MNNRLREENDNNEINDNNQKLNTMGFWKDVKKEWTIPFKGTKRQKERFWLDMACCAAGSATLIYNHGESLFIQFTVFFLTTIIVRMIWNLIRAFAKRV